MGALDLYIAQMPNSSLQTTRVYWRDKLHMEQLPDDLEWYEAKKIAGLGWFHRAGLARASSKT